MAVDMFLDLGDIKGEARDNMHKDSIDVLAWSWGANNTGNAHLGGGLAAGKVNVHDLSLTKFVDKASPEIFLATCNGKHIPTATLIVRKAGEQPLEYLKITMEDVLITGYATGGNGGDERLTENITLNFAKVKLGYVEQTSTGSAGAQPEVGWDIAANTKQ